MSATFAPDYLEPGAYPIVVLEPTPQALVPAFVSALIGRTSSDKPVAMDLLRNEVPDVYFEIDQTTKAIKAGVNSIGGLTVIEPRRMDLLATVAASTDIPDINAVIDELGLSHLKGEENSWSTFFNDGTIGGAAIAWFIEWVTKYRFTKANSSTHAPIENIAGSNATIELARISRDSKFSFGGTVFPTGITPGFFGSFISAIPAKYNLHVTTDSTVTPGVFTFTLTETDSNGDPISATHLDINSIGVNITAGILPDATGASLDAVGGDNMRSQGSAVKDIVYDPVAAANYLEFDLTSETGYVFKFRVNLTKLVTEFTDAASDNFFDAITVSVAGPSFGTGGGVGTVPPAGSAGTKYSVSYRALKTVSDLIPRLFDDLTSVQLEHGAIDANTLNDALSFGAFLYFQQGGGSLYLMPLRDDVIDPTNGFDLSVDTEYEAAVADALEKLEDVADVSLVVPLSPTEPAGVSVNPGTFRPQIYNNVKGHVINMSTITEAKPRMAMMGARANNDNEDTFIAGAEAGLTNRVVYIAPATASVSAGGKAFLADGSSVAAALAGILSNPGFNAGEPITGKSLTAFADIPDPFTRKQKNRIAKQGVTIIEKGPGGSVVRHFLTTDQRNPLAAEAKVTKIAIDIRRTLKIALDNSLINTRVIDSETISTAASLVTLVLDQKRQSQVINNFEIVDIKVNEQEPRQLDIDVSIQPVFDLNWIRLTATFVTS